MTIAECYRALGGDYTQVEKRLCSPGMIKRFISRFLEDDSFGLLLCAMGDGRRENAHRAAYTLLDTVVHDYTATVSAIRDYMSAAEPQKPYPPTF